jgi:endonuclease G
MCICALLVSCSLFAASALAVNFPAWNNGTSKPHVVFGEPTYIRHDPNHNYVRKYKAFTVYYDDTVLSPRWTAIKMTKRVADKNSNIKRRERFLIDKVLKKKKYKVTKHEDYNNPRGVKKWDRGHMVQFDDARGYGVVAAKESFYTSNVCPQLALLNQRGWLSLEETCTELARDYNVVWIYTGPIYGEYKRPFARGRKVPKPIAFYKIVVSPGDSDQVDVIAFRMPHKSIPRDVDLSDYLVSIDDIEGETGLDFLHELEDDLEDEIESEVWEIWPDLPNE